MNVHSQYETPLNHYYGFARGSTDDKIYDCEMNVAATVSNGKAYILFEHISGKTLIDKMNIKAASVTRVSHADGYLIGSATSCTNCVITNLQDNSYHAQPDDSYLIAEPGEHLTITNASFYGNFKNLASNDSDLAKVKAVNILFGKYKLSSGLQTVVDLALQTGILKHVYFADSNVSADEMNQHLADKTGIPKGTYLPWMTEGDKKVLDFDVSQSSMYVIP